MLNTASVNCYSYVHPIHTPGEFDGVIHFTHSTIALQKETLRLLSIRIDFINFDNLKFFAKTEMKMTQYLKFGRCDLNTLKSMTYSPI